LPSAWHNDLNVAHTIFRKPSLIAIPISPSWRLSNTRRHAARPEGFCRLSGGESADSLAGLFVELRALFLCPEMRQIVFDPQLRPALLHQRLDLLPAGQRLFAIELKPGHLIGEPLLLIVV
jgi:hypothetical protein